ncbi:MAG TPA: plastocyanin/azurin family copper-binding protein [Vicinamibacterales bacterium]|nr:plastocyanin/azurin family copper-binding protein [Vicinamibacterales bacterium]
MSRRRRSFVLCTHVIAALALPSFAWSAPHQQPQTSSTPRVLLDQSPRAIEYQLGRLTNDELVLVERNDADPKYRLVYLAILTRRGVPQQFRDESVAALAKLDNATPSVVLLEALSKVPADDPVTGEKLVGMLVGQAPATLAKDRSIFMKSIESSSPPMALRGAYAALLTIDGTPDAAWKVALAHDRHLLELLHAVPLLPAAGKAGEVRPLLFPPIAALIKDSTEPEIKVAALGALGWTRRNAATFDLLAREAATSDAGARNAAITSLQAIPESAWGVAAIEPLVRAIAARARELPPDQRTEPATLDMLQFGDRLAAKIPGDTGRDLRRDLRSLGVRVVRIQTVPEKLSFDVKWFAVEAGKPVQIVLANLDAMPHNLVVGKPGSLEEIGTKGGAMPMPTDPAATAKPFVPDSPLVLHATNLVKEGDTERLGFTAPREPGEYIFVCTFPGHWVRMYGIMLVVDSLDSWEAKPTVPTDPMTKQPFTSQRN